MEKPLTEIITSPHRKEALEKRYWPKVNVADPNECWNWNAKARHPYGYGRMTAGRGVNLKAHQIGWALENGPIPVGMLICHACDNPSCCNPNHLFLGSQTDNMGDAKRKGRISNPPRHIGEAHPNAKLKNHQIAEIAADKRPAADVAVTYGISAKTVYLIRRGERK
jgi:HNH endonuclease